MNLQRHWFPLLLLLLLTFLKSSYGEAGTSARYGSSFLPTACFGYDVTQFPSNNFFASAGDELWNNGSACGRYYSVKCLGGPCTGEVINVKIVDYMKTSVSRPSREGSTMALSNTAFRAITTSTADSIQIEFRRRRFINKKLILSIFHKVNWEFSLEVEFQSWTLNAKDLKLTHGNGTWSFELKIQVGFLILKVKATFRDF